MKKISKIDLEVFQKIRDVFGTQSDILRWSLFAKIINGLTLFYFRIKIFIVDVQLGSKYASEYYLIYAWDND